MQLNKKYRINQKIICIRDASNDKPCHPKMKLNNVYTVKKYLGEKIIEVNEIDGGIFHISRFKSIHEYRKIKLNNIFENGEI